MGVILEATEIVVDSDLPECRIQRVVAGADNDEPIAVGDGGFSIDDAIDPGIRIVARGFRVNDDEFEIVTAPYFDCDDPCDEPRSRQHFALRLDAARATLQLRVGIELRAASLRRWLLSYLLLILLFSGDPREQIDEVVRLLNELPDDFPDADPDRCTDKTVNDLDASAWWAMPPSAELLRERREEWEQGIVAEWEGHYPFIREPGARLPDAAGWRSPEALNLAVAVEWNPPAERLNITVDVIHGDDRHRFLCFHTSMSAKVAAHEFGHMLALADEYPPDPVEDAPCPGRVSDLGPSSLMYSSTSGSTQPPHYRYIAEWLSNRLCSLYAVTKYVVATGGGGAQAGDVDPYPLPYVYTEDGAFCPGPVTFRIEELEG